VPALLLVWHLSSGFLARQSGGYSGYWLEEAPTTAGAFALGPPMTPSSLVSAAASAASTTTSSGSSASAATASVLAEGQDSADNSSSHAGATSQGSNSATASGTAEPDDGFTPLAVLRVAVLKGKNLGLRRKRLTTKPNQTKGTLRTTKESSEGSNSSDSAHGTHPSSSVTSSGLDSTEDVDLSNHLKDSSSSSNSNYVATQQVAVPSEETYVARPTRYYVRVSYLPGEFTAPYEGTSINSSTTSTISGSASVAAPPGGGELFIGHTRYSSRSHNPVWVDRSDDSDGDENGMSGRHNDNNDDSESISSSSHRRRGGGGGGSGNKSSARGSVALLGTLLDALLPSEDGRSRGGGEYGDGSDNETDGRTVHSIKRRWPRLMPPHLRTAKQAGGEHGESSKHSSYSGEGDDAFFYHILQPRRRAAKSQRNNNKGRLVPWTEAPGAVRLRVLAESGLDAMVDQVCIQI